MSFYNLSSTSSGDLAAIAQITRDAGVNLDDCYQCGKCSAGCPLSDEMDLYPRKVIRMLQLGQVSAVLKSRAPWVCATCMTCTARCPQQIDIDSLMLSVRHAAKRAGLRPVREADIFDDLFMAGVRRYGKSNEALLAARFNLSSGHLFQDVLNAPKMAKRGMIGPSLHKVKDRAAMRRLFGRALRTTEGEKGDGI